jgi:putative FmdB family regulatory protein
MPIYEYRRADGTTFDILQSITDDPLTEDPDTGQPVERVLHAPAVHFKGSGFYNTDYGTRRRNREKAAEAKSEGSSGDGGADKKASDSKSESKASTSDAKKPD